MPDPMPEEWIRPFLPERASSRDWLGRIDSLRPGEWGCRGDFFRYVLDTSRVTVHAKRPGLKKGLAAPFLFSRWCDKDLDGDFKQAIGIDCRDARCSFFSICKRWGFSCTQAVAAGTAEFNVLFHRDQGEVICRFFRLFDGVQIVVEDGHAVFSGNSPKGQGRLQVRAFRDLNFFPSGAIFRQDFERSVDDLQMAKLPKKSVFSTAEKVVRLNSRELAGTKPVEAFTKTFDGHLVSRAYNSGGEAGATLSFSSSADPLAFSWLDGDGVDCVFVC